MSNLIHPPSEFRRKYMRDLVALLKKSACLDHKRAKELASVIVNLFEERIFWGQTIDLGFMSIEPKRKAPSTVMSNLAHSRGVYILGERIVWKANFSEAWLRRRKPTWAR